MCMMCVCVRVFVYVCVYCGGVTWDKCASSLPGWPLQLLNCTYSPSGAPEREEEEKKREEWRRKRGRGRK